MHQIIHIGNLLKHSGVMASWAVNEEMNIKVARPPCSRRLDSTRLISFHQQQLLNSFSGYITQSTNMRYIFAFLSFAVAAFATADDPDAACKVIPRGASSFTGQMLMLLNFTGPFRWLRLLLDPG
jgi:hypothetical protein